ncbi:hypothetical protein [Kitasatospora purpeofusca]|uniref:hypothetical protein n=1 Tax=Kitasatospora purpeofusca TaxID=67352 RepID=UPI0035DF4C57
MPAERGCQQLPKSAQVETLRRQPGVGEGMPVGPDLGTDGIPRSWGRRIVRVALADVRNRAPGTTA